jgi:hypothetical protein
LNGQPARHLLRILKYIERIDFAPSHGNDMEPAVEVRGVAIGFLLSGCSKSRICTD